MVTKRDFGWKEALPFQNPKLSQIFTFHKCCPRKRRIFVTMTVEGLHNILLCFSKGKTMMFLVDKGLNEEVELLKRYHCNSFGTFSKSITKLKTQLTSVISQKANATNQYC